MGCWGRAAAGRAAARPPAIRYGGLEHAPAGPEGVVRRRPCVPAGASVPAAPRTERRPAAEAAPSARRRRWPWRPALAVLGGVALLLAFPGFDRPAPPPPRPAPPAPGRPRP